MNDPGTPLAWLALQLTLLLIPTVTLHALASRRSAATGAWIATVGLGLTLLLPVLTWLPSRRLADVHPAAIERAQGADPGLQPGVSVVGAGSRDPRRAASGVWLTFDPSRSGGIWGGLLSRLRPREPATVEALRQFGGIAARLALAASAASLGYLLLGLWSLRRCLRRARPIDDPLWNRLHDEISLAIGPGRAAVLLETPDLATPATAGWIRPAILLPLDWPTWDEPTLRAVLAHELAHIRRHDYAAGLVGRLAHALYFYHPLVHWLAARLELQQELAADAVGARLGGGRVAYLLALSTLALRHEEKVPRWPARMFLPPQGSLIRRIAMLREDATLIERPWSRTTRWLAIAGLLGLAVVIGLLPSPLRAEDPPGAAVEKTSLPAPKNAAGTGAMSADWLYVPENIDGLVKIRPAAAFRRIGRPGLAELMSRTIGLEFLPEEVLANWARSGSTLQPKPLDLADVEWITAGVRIGIHKPLKTEKGQDRLHTIMINGTALRMSHAFDWPTFLRRWGCDLIEHRVEGRAFYEVRLDALPRESELYVYLPDDRTIVLDSRQGIEKLVRRGEPERPSYLSGDAWREASRGILAFAFRNDPGFAKRYDLGRADDAVVLSLLDGADHWILSVDDTDQIGVHARAACRNADTRWRLKKRLEDLVVLGRKEPDGVTLPPGRTPHQQNELRQVQALLASVEIQIGADSIRLDALGHGSLAFFASLIEADLKEMDAQISKAMAIRGDWPDRKKR